MHIIVFAQIRRETGSKCSGCRLTIDHGLGEDILGKNTFVN